MRKSAGKSSISTLTALAVFTLFTVCVLCVLLSGAGVYRRLVNGGQESYARRTATQYIAARVQQSESAAHLWTETFGEADALVIAEHIDGEQYHTRVYCHDGWLMELFARADGELEPEDGEKLLQIGGLDCRMESGLLMVSVVDTAGARRELVFALRGGEGGRP